MPQIHRPIPRRAFEITPASTDSSMPPSPDNEAQNPELLTKQHSERSPPPSRTRSILNLTSSTLLGIYSGATDGAQQELNTPWGTGAQTPALGHGPSMESVRLQIPSFPFNDGSSKRPTLHKAPRKTFRSYYLPLFFQTVMLFGFGMGFGTLITHLHHTQQISPVPVPRNTSPQYYQVAWGVMGVIIGNALPRLDLFFEDDEAVADGFEVKPKQNSHIRTASSSSRTEKERSLADNGVGPIWHSAVRSIGAFVGIAFALVCFSPSPVTTVANAATEEDSVAINFTGIVNIGCGRPDSMVPHRSFKAWTSTFINSQYRRNDLVSLIQPTICTRSRNPS